MSDRKMTLPPLILFIAVALSVVLCGCTKPPQPGATEQLPPQPTQATQPDPEEEDPKPLGELPPPKPEEVLEAVTRIYKAAVVVDTGMDQNSVVGDFNGDGSEDLVVTVKPVESMMSEINSEIANWIRVDARKNSSPPTRETKSVPMPGPTFMEKDDVLLAVIHGFGPGGWRDSAAQQTYLLRNAAGNNMKRVTIDEMVKKGKGGMKLPRLYGDVIQETLSGEAGFLYWMGARYTWFSPQAASAASSKPAKK